VGDGVRVLGDLALGEAQADVAGGGQRGVLRAVAFEGDAGPVVAPAVDLDDEAVRREVEVDLVWLVVEGGEGVIDERPRQARASAEGLEATLELAAGERGVIGGRRRSALVPLCPWWRWSRSSIARWS
jgi:hypothetical protein